MGMSSASLKQGKQLLELFSGSSSRQVQGFIEAGDLVKAMLAADLSQIDRAAFEQLMTASSQLVHGLYVPPEIQIEQFRLWNSEFGLGFGPTDINAITGDIPVFPENDPFKPLTLTWTLDTLARTLKVKADILATVVKAYYVNPILFEEDAVRLTPTKKGDIPVFPERQLSWSVDNLVANKGKAPRDCTEQRLSGVELLDIATQHPKTLQAQNGTDMPYWNLGGIQVDPDRDGSFGSPPYLYWDRDDQGFGLNVGRADDADSGWSVPVREW